MKKFINIILLQLFFFTASYATGNYPTARGKYDPITSILIPNGTVIFSGSDSHDNDTQNHNIAQQCNWHLNYKNSTFTSDVTSTSSTVSHKYTQAGTYTVAVKYKDNDGWWSKEYIHFK